MIEKNQLDKLINSPVKIELSNNTYFKGTLREVSDSSIILEFFDKRKTVIATSKIEFVKEVLE